MQRHPARPGGRCAGPGHQHGELGVRRRTHDEQHAHDGRRRLPRALGLHAHCLVRDGCDALHARARRDARATGSGGGEEPLARGHEPAGPVPQADQPGRGGGAASHRGAAGPLRRASAWRRCRLPGACHGGSCQGHRKALRAGEGAWLLSRRHSPDQRRAQRHDRIRVRPDGGADRV
ncbi:hypothetical protein D9M68_785450 [compost metagenome]